MQTYTCMHPEVDPARRQAHRGARERAHGLLTCHPDAVREPEPVGLRPLRVPARVQPPGALPQRAAPDAGAEAPDQAPARRHRLRRLLPARPRVPHDAGTLR